MLEIDLFSKTEQSMIGLILMLYLSYLYSRNSPSPIPITCPPPIIPMEVYNEVDIFLANIINLISFTSIFPFSSGRYLFETTTGWEPSDIFPLY